MRPEPRRLVRFTHRATARYERHRMAGGHERLQETTPQASEQRDCTTLVGGLRPSISYWYRCVLDRCEFTAASEDPGLLHEPVIIVLLARALLVGGFTRE